MKKTTREAKPSPSTSRKAALRAELAASGDTSTIVQGMVPPRKVLLEFIADNPDRATKREIAKAFGLKGEARVELKDLLRDLEDEGLLQKNRKALTRPGALPPMTVLDITTRDKDGDLIGRPAE